MVYQHLDCTTEERRIEICKKYKVHADDCITLYGGRTVRSDANNREIRDKYYQFSCTCKETGEHYIITCGAGAARHLCSIIKEQMPHAMNPFIDDTYTTTMPGGGRTRGDSRSEWNPLRRQLYYAVQIFIIRYQDDLTPGTKIFKLLQSIVDERYIHLEPHLFQYQKFIDVVVGFHTNIPRIIRDLEKFGKVRKFDLNKLAVRLDELLPECDNIFRDY